MCFRGQALTQYHENMMSLKALVQARLRGNAFKAILY